MRLVASYYVVLLTLVFVMPAWAGQSPGKLKGTVTSIGPGGGTLFLAGAGVIIRSPVLSSGMMASVTNEQGEFLVSDFAAGEYTITVELQGFKPAVKAITVKPDVTTEVTIQLEIAGITGEVTVEAGGQAIERVESSQQIEINQRQLTYAPLVSEKFQDTLPLVPGVVRGPDGLINIKGARSNLSALLVNSTNATDPVSGESGISLPIDAVQSVEVLSSPYLAEYGKLAGGVTSVETKAGGDRWRYSFNNFLPRLRHRQDPFTGNKALAGIESFTPRLRFSGPLVKDRLVFAQTFQYRFVRTRVDVLPDPQEPPAIVGRRGEVERDTKLESFDSFTEFNYRINTKNDLTTTLSIFPQNNQFVNLNAFNPPLVTPNFRQRGFQLAFNERAFITSNVVLNSLISIRQFDVEIFPHGPRPMTFTPEVNTGNFFNRQDRNTDRIEVLETLGYQPSIRHFFKFGVNVAHTQFDGLHQSFPVRLEQASRTLSQLIEFVGDSLITRNNLETTLFAQDKWMVNRNVTFDLGLRYDREGIADENLFAPRLGFVVVPSDDNRTAIRGGIGLFWGKMQLNVGIFDQLQQRIVTTYGPDGRTPVGPPRRFLNVVGAGKPETPYNVSWNVEMDRQLFSKLTLRLGYSQRDGRRELIINPLEDRRDPTRGILELSNGGRSRYKEFQITGRYQYGESSNFFISYVRSAATGDLNTFNEFFGNFENPILRPNEVSRMSFDAPNRLLVWGNIDLPWKISLFPVLDVHDGFPFSHIDENRNFIGRRNRAGRFPVFASLDMQVQKGFKLRFRGKEYNLRAGVKLFNLTNHFNPRDVQNNIASLSFGRFHNSVGTLVRGTFNIDF
ncbi:MAG: TonB-dependent receptor [Acidobacteria bacterium]|nr:TonB-dependent receptor [Acidobacteriota bacterium]